MVGFRRLTHRYTRQDQNFPAHIDSAPCDTPATVRNTFSENEAKTLNLKQNVTTKSQKGLSQANASSQANANQMRD